MTEALHERLAQVSEILIALAGSPIPSQQFQVLADYTSLVVPYDFLAFCLVAEDEKGYLIFPLDGIGGDAVPQRPYPLHEGVVGRILQKKRPEIIEDLSQDPDASPELEGFLTQLGLMHALVLPIRQEHKVLGALYFASQNPVAYTDSDLQVGRLLAAGMASSLESARYYQRLADERSTLAAVLTSTQDGVLVVNETGQVLLANPAFEQMMNVPLGTLAGRMLAEKLNNRSLLALFGEQSQAAEIPLPDGRTAQAAAAQVITEFGEFVGWTAVLRDITLLKELEQMKNDFVNTVSHDLKNPISTISLATEMIARTGTLNAKQSDLQSRILQTATYMNELVTDLLDLGKIQAGLDLRLAPFDLMVLVDEVLVALAGAAEHKQQQVETELLEELMITADERRLKQVLLNLVGNAIKYTPAHGQVCVTVSTSQDQVLVAVQDNGIGIPVQDVPYVFDKFYRVQNEATRGIKGTGLGLAITRSIVEAHNGRIWVDSTPGEGSTFTFSLPLARNT